MITREGLLFVHVDLQDVGKDSVHLKVHGVRHYLPVIPDLTTIKGTVSQDFSVH
jgi:hypothetical protein